MTVSFRRLLAVLLCLLSATAAAQTPPPSGISLHRFTATERSWAVNAFWLESDKGIVLIDTLLLKSDARLLVAMMKQTGKPLAGVIITHPHVDHFGGITVVRDAYKDVPVYATTATAGGMKAVHDRAVNAGWITRMFGDDYETTLSMPDHLVASGATLQLAGMTFTLDDVGAIDASNNTVVFNKELNALFSGDATVSNGAVYMGEGHSKAALEAVAAMAAKYAEVKRVHSGHYDSMRPRPLFAENLEQIRYLRSLMRQFADDPANRAAEGGLTEAAREKLVSETAAHFEAHHNYGYGPEGFASFNLPALEMEILTEMEAEKAEQAAPAKD